MTKAELKRLTIRVTSKLMCIGPTRCSGLEVMRYDAESLHSEFGQRFRLVESCKELLNTPFGTTQQFLYCYCRVE